MTDIYLSSTFKHPWNVAFNSQIGDILEKEGFVCYLPHRDTNQKGPPADIFSADLRGIQNASCVLAIAANETPNWGAEVGYAYSIQKPIIALKQDDHDIPLICRHMMTDSLSVKNVDDTDDYTQSLVAILKKYTS